VKGQADDLPSQQTPSNRSPIMDGIGLAMNIVALVQILQQTYETLKGHPPAPAGESASTSSGIR
jgi:hypothetical protein